jgi:hypothetical protein
MVVSALCAVLTDDDRVNQTVCLDVGSEVGQFLVGHHREQIGGRVDRPFGGTHRHPRRFRIATATSMGSSAI